MKMDTSAASYGPYSKRDRPVHSSYDSILAHFRKKWQLYMMLILPVAYVTIFGYIPMGGVLLAFKDISFRTGILASPWVGLKYFKLFLGSPLLPQLLKNTLALSIYGLVAGFPIPILLALALNEVKSNAFRKTVQLVTYAPYFISTVVIVGIIYQIFDPHLGMVNTIIKALGFEMINFMGKSSMFRSVYVWSGVWQGAGYSAIIYIAALAHLDQNIIEASIIDGANRFQRVINIDLPSLAPTIAILLILSVGGLMSVGFEKVYLMQNYANLPVSEIISTHVYKRGLLDNQYGYATAVGLFNSVINLVLLTLANFVSRKVSETSLW